MSLAHIDTQMLAARDASEAPVLADAVWASLATTIHKEVSLLDEPTLDRVRNSALVPPERYCEELVAFQAWMDRAHNHAEDPVIVRAQVMTQLYVSFVWLRDSLFNPLSRVVAPESVFASVAAFLGDGSRRRLRNAIAHGRWCYLSGFDGLECWDGPNENALRRFEVNSADLAAWQLLSRGTAIAVLLALTGQ